MEKVHKKRPLQVYMIDSERDFVDKQARKTGFSKSDYIRMLINNEKKKVERYK